MIVLNVCSKTLKRLIAEKFPICSADLMVGTTRHSEHSNCLQQVKFFSVHYRVVKAPFGKQS